MSAILFGSISSVADTSELQRQAFNQAFQTHGLDWQWDRDDYRTMLTGSGGATRISEYAESRGQSVDAQAVHETKSQIFQASLEQADLRPRPGVVDTISTAKQQDWKIGLVTTTSRDNISALLAALAPEVKADDFDVIVDATKVDEPKPDQAAYTFAVQNLGESSDDCVAVEDNVEGVKAAKAAGLPCVGFPNENTAVHDFAAADRRVDHLDAHELQQLTHRG